MRCLRPVALLLVLAVVAGGGLSACGTKTVTDTDASGATTVRTVEDVKFPKTKFLLHAGLAFGAFHRYVYKPYRAGAFRSGQPGRVKALAKAAASAAFTYHELQQADDAAESSDVLRRKLHDPLARTLSSFKSLPGLIKGGGTLAGIAGANSLLDGLKSSAAGAGATITDK